VLRKLVPNSRPVSNLGLFYEKLAYKWLYALQNWFRNKTVEVITGNVFKTWL
jgi:hypothetical protein